MKTKKKKLKTLEEIQRLHENLTGLLKNQRPIDPKAKYVFFEVRDNNNLIILITSLLEVCVFALDGEGMLLSPENKNATKEDSVSRVLELVLSILPDAQLYFIDQLSDKLSTLEQE